MGKWSKCFACKNVSGIRIRQVVCVKESQTPGSEDTLEDDKKCEGTKPATREVCESHVKCRSSKYIDKIPKHLLKDVHKQITRKSTKRDVVSNFFSMFYYILCIITICMISVISFFMLLLNLVMWVFTF